MNKLINILKTHNVDECEAAEMVYSFLCEHGETEDQELIEELNSTFFVSEEA